MRNEEQFQPGQSSLAGEAVSDPKAMAFRLEAAKAAAQQVADLCARAVEAAHQGNVPHAGIGTREISQKPEFAKAANSPTNNNKIMNETKLSLKGNWNVIKGKLKQTYGELTDSDLTYAEGQEDELIGRIQKRVGATHAEIRHLIDRFNRP